MASVAVFMQFRMACEQAIDAFEAAGEAIGRCSPQQADVADGVQVVHPEWGRIEALAWAESEGGFDPDA